MLEIEDHVEAGQLRVTARPNSSMSPLGSANLFMIITLWVLSVALAFALIGAWPVIVYAMMTIIGLSLGFQFVLGRADDYEQLVVERGKLSIEFGSGGQIKSHQLHSGWVRVVMDMTPAGNCSRLAIKAHGKEIDFGRHLCEESKAEVGRLLKPRLGGGFELPQPSISNWEGELR